jgi:hypothetical protein
MRLYEVEYVYDKMRMGTDLFADFSKMVEYINHWMDKMGYTSPNGKYMWDRNLTLKQLNQKLMHQSVVWFNMSDKETIFIKDIYTKDSEVED